MKYEMKLESQFFDYIENGSKRIEIRLNDEKRQKIKIGDIIRFNKISCENKYIDTTVEDLIYFKNFLDIVNYFDISLIADKNFNKSLLLNKLNEIYSKEDQEKYGVVGIKISL